MGVKLLKEGEVIGIHPSEMNDGDVGEIVAWTSSNLIGRVVQRFGDYLVSVGKPYGNSWPSGCGSDPHKLPSGCRVRILQPGLPRGVGCQPGVLRGRDLTVGKTSVGRKIVRGLNELSGKLKRGEAVKVTTVQVSRRQGILGGNSKPPSKAPAVAPREPSTENTDDPRGKFGLFLRDWLARHDDQSGKKLAEALDMKESRTIRWWAQGKAGPAFRDLDRVADALGYANWAKLAAAVERFIESHPPTA